MLTFFSDFFLLVFICLILFLPGGSGADFSTFITIFLLILTLLLLLLSNDGATDDDDDDDDDDGDDGGGGGGDNVFVMASLLLMFQCCCSFRLVGFLELTIHTKIKHHPCSPVIKTCI